MNEPPPPLRHKMDPPFGNMKNGEKILISNTTGSAIREMMVYRRPQEGMFGITIPFCQPPVFAGEPGPLGAPGELVTRDAGYFSVEYLRLSEAEIRSIEEANHQDYRFKIELPPDRIRFR